jgi:hypothetical protein
MTNATAMALDPVPNIAGVAASIIGTLQNLFASASAILSGLLYDGTMRTAILLMGVFGIVTLLTFLIGGAILRRPMAQAVSD